MSSIQHFTEAETEWDLARLNADLAQVKQACSGRRTAALTELEATCLRGLLGGHSPTEIAIALNRDITGLRVDLSRGLYEYIEILTEQRPKNWRQVAFLLEKAGYKLSAVRLNPGSLNSSLRQDLGEVIDVSRFYGRAEALEAIKERIVEDSCRVIAIVGMGGIGKTALAAKLVQDELADRSKLSNAGFKGVFWRSLRYAPPAADLVAELLQFTGNTSDSPTANMLDQQISQLLAHLRHQRYLIVLDDWECLLQEGKLAGYCTQAHEGYGRFLQRLAIEQHQSCLLLITREQPVEITSSAGEGTLVHLFKLKGLKLEEAKALLVTRGFSPNESALPELVQIHRGNPAALKLAAATIQEIFDGSISQFLAQTSLMLGDILQQVLEQQFERLSAVEQTIMFWLAVAGQAVSLRELQNELVEAKSELLLALESLRRRSLLDKISKSGSASREVLFALEPVVMKYVTQRFVTHIAQDLCQVMQTRSLAQLGLLRSHQLVRQEGSEILPRSERMLQRVQNKLKTAQGGDVEQVRAHLEEILTWLQEQHPESIGYAETNVRRLLELITPHCQHPHDCSG